jgi:hypothetical protein
MTTTKANNMNTFYKGAPPHNKRDVYDALGRMRSMESGDLGKKEYWYDAAGNLEGCCKSRFNCGDDNTSYNNSSRRGTINKLEIYGWEV